VKKKKILVTGSNSFVGRFLIETLLKDKKNIIVALYNKKVFKFNSFPKKQISYLRVDLAKDNLRVIPTDIDIIYHLAGYYSSSDTNLNEKNLMKKSNVIATKRLAYRCKYMKIKHFIFVSSIATCESSKDLIINEDNGAPISYYGKSKKEAEKFLFKISKGYFNVTVLRATALFGELHKGSVYDLVKAIKDKKFIHFGRGSGVTNFYYIRDFINLLVNVCCNKSTYNGVFIASDKSFELNIVVNWIIKSLNYKNRIFYIPLWVGYILAFLFEILSLMINKPLTFSYKRFKSMINKTSFSNYKLSNAMKVSQKYGVKKGIERTIKWYKKNKLL